MKKVDNMYVVDLYKKLLLSDLLSIWNTQSACERNENMKKKLYYFNLTRLALKGRLPNDPVKVFKNKAIRARVAERSKIKSIF